jgi:tRNA pseudouridine38-40 synthase
LAERTIKLTVQYDGTEFVGWQRQASGVSIQGAIEDVLAQIEGAPVTLHGAGRTDAGVHALAQTASARLTASVDDERLARALNAHLPGAIRVTTVTTMADGFHARFSAIGKVYEYRIWNGAAIPPFIRLYAWHIPEALDLGAMRAASHAIVGEHDFAGFRSARGVNRSTVRRISRTDWRRAGQLLIFEIAGTGFLRHMVRSLVGTLVEIGRGQRAPAEMGELLAEPDRSAAGRTAPALGLFLVKVEY